MMAVTPSSHIKSGAKSGGAPANRRCRSELCLEMSHLNEDPLVSPRSALIFPPRSWVNLRPDERNSIGRSDIVREVGRVREFVPRHRSGPARSPVFMSLRFDYDGNGRVDLRHSARHTLDNPAR